MRVAISGVLALALTGCAGLSGATAAAPTTAAATGSGPIFVTGSETLGRPCEVVAVLDIQLPSDETGNGSELLRGWAQRLGGTAVLSARYAPPTGGRPARAWGVVVRELATAAQDYEAIARIEVTADDASRTVDALRDKARALGADRLIDARLEPGGDGHPAKLSALAVRSRR